MRNGKASRFEVLHLARHRSTILAVSIEQRAFEVGADLNIHRRADRGGDAFFGVGTSQQRAVQDIIAIGRHDKIDNRQAHLFGNETGKHITEIACRHRETDRAVRCAKADRGCKVIDHLRQHPAPVDRIDPGQPHIIAKGEIVEHILHQRLTIVKITIDGKGMDVRLDRRSHLAALHFGHAAMRVKDDDIDSL